MLIRLIMAAVGLCLAGLLGSCAGTGSENAFSAYVADHWPHWAGGMPADAPPRPGTPGYAEFIAHGQAEQQAGPDTVPAIASAPASGVPAKPVMQTALPPPAVPSVPQAAPQAQSVPQAAADDPSVVRGGLY